MEFPRPNPQIYGISKRVFRSQGPLLSFGARNNGTQGLEGAAGALDIATQALACGNTSTRFPNQALGWSVATTDFYDSRHVTATASTGSCDARVGHRGSEHANDECRIRECVAVRITTT